MIAERRFVIIGAGMAGRSLAAALGGQGARVVAVASRRIESAREAAALAGCPFATTDAVAAARRGDVVVLSVPDDAIAAVCEQVAAGGGFQRGAVVVHLSGALGSQALAAAQASGASALAFHPIQTFARADGRLFEGVTCVLEGDSEGAALGMALAEFLGARAVEIRAEDKALYHAALCIACNYFVTLADAGAGLLAEAGLGEAALPALVPLLRNALENLARVGLPDALTGPISRGDLATVQAHLDALAARAPELLPLYRLVGLRTIGLALRKGTVREARADALRSLLGVPPASGLNAGSPL
jgi:predicted short-subunit dehydrogenase-like oxidoreductase (DUF2520 family)